MVRPRHLRVVTDPEDFRDQRIVIIGGGDSAFDWAHQLLDRARSVTLVHRSDRFRAHGATVTEVQTAAAQGRAQLLTFHELADITSTDDRLSGVVLKDIKAKTTRALDVDAILPMLGFVSDLGAIGEWGLQIVNDEIVGDEHDGDRTSGHLRGGRHHDVSGEAQADRDGVQRSGDRGESGRALDLPGEEGESGAQLEPGDLRAERRLAVVRHWRLQ